MWVGGEFYYDDQWQRDRPQIDTSDMIFLNGGKACLIVIADTLRSRGIDRILLPAYLCPTIVNTLESRGLCGDYYPVRSDLTIDLDSLDERINHYQAVFFINYFGFRHSDAVYDYFNALRKRGVFVVEDNAQAGFASRCMGDFVFNSIRKLAPYDGGYLYTRHNVSDLVSRYPSVENRRLPVMRKYRQRLGEYRYRGIGSRDELMELYEQAERFYELDVVVAGDPDERQSIEHLDWNGIKRARRENYAYLLELLANIPRVSPLFPALQPDIMPLGLPVYIEEIPRDHVFDALGTDGIGLTVHWDALLRDPRLNSDPVVVDMASRMLTLCIDQRVTRKQLEYQADRLYQLLK